nr:CFE protein [Tanacetum cinerariifolium]
MDKLTMEEAGFQNCVSGTELFDYSTIFWGNFQQLKMKMKMRSRQRRLYGHISVKDGSHIQQGLLSLEITKNLLIMLTALLCGPHVKDFPAVTDLPVIWSVIISWLKPPYLYVIINVIIFIIAASTRFQHNDDNNNNETSNENITQPQVGSLDDVQPLDLMSDIMPVGYDVEEHVLVDPPVVVKDVEMVSASESEVVVSGDTWRPLTSVVDGALPDMKVREKQLVGSRIGHNRKPLKANPEGARALRVLKPKKHETMESTWKMITEGHHMPLTRHLNKSDTFQSRNESPAAVTNKKVVRKSETFKDRTNYENENQYLSPSSSSNLSPATSGKLMKEGSPSQDELNRRVEAFIKKFNDDMRLQRQESLNQYMDMVNRGAH